MTNHAGKYHDSRAIISESITRDDTLIIQLPDGNDLLGYAPGSSFYCAGDSQAIEKGWLTVNDQESPLIAGYGMKVTPRPPVPEKMYLVCVDCGEAFDEIGIAHQHEATCEDATFLTKPESDAF